MTDKLPSIFPPDPVFTQQDPHDASAGQVRVFRAAVKRARRLVSDLHVELGRLYETSSKDQLEHISNLSESMRVQVDAVKLMGDLLVDMELGPSSPECKLMHKVASDTFRHKHPHRRAAAYSGLGDTIHRCIKLGWLKEGENTGGTEGPGQLIITGKGKRYILAMKGELPESCCQ